MKKVLQIVTALSFGFFALTGLASAQQQNCVIDNTGPSSVNVCTNTVERTCTITNNTNITVDNTNYQVSETGAATVIGSTGSGGASSGSSNNNTSTNISFEVTNPGEEGAPDQGNCVVTTVTRTPVTPESPAPVTSTTTQAPVTNLPKTSSVSPLAFVGTAIAGIAALAVIARVSVLAYARNRR